MFLLWKDVDKNMHVDHFIPWIFVKNDNLWNFVLACPKCNIRKSNRLPTIDYLIKIESRNYKIMQLSSAHSVDNIETLEREFSGYDEGLLRRMWSYAKMSGIKETNKI